MRYGRNTLYVSVLHKPDPALRLTDSEHSGEGDLVDRRPIGPSGILTVVALRWDPEVLRGRVRLGRPARR